MLCGWVYVYEWWVRFWERFKIGKVMSTYILLSHVTIEAFNEIFKR